MRWLVNPTEILNKTDDEEEKANTLSIQVLALSGST
jgi:hypothetical protein